MRPGIVLQGFRQARTIAVPAVVNWIVAEFAIIGVYAAVSALQGQLPLRAKSVHPSELEDVAPVDKLLPLFNVAGTPDPVEFGSFPICARQGPVVLTGHQRLDHTENRICV